jgi:hypothetical protein
VTARTTAYDDLSWLDDHGAIEGVARIMHERRHQIEKGFTPEHDRSAHSDGWLAGKVAVEAGYAVAAEFSTSVDESAMVRAGATAAAEIDRLADHGC